MNEELTRLCSTVNARGIEKPLFPGELIEWINETKQLFAEELAKFGEAPDWNCLFADFGDPGVLVLGKFETERVLVTVTLVPVALFADTRGAIDEGGDWAELIGRIEPLLGKPIAETVVIS
ncbi:MAG: hypothetical protein QM723_14790 [Myxococcaceae bacterium]